MEESVVLEVAGGDFVEEPEVDVAGAESGEAAVEGGQGLGNSEGGALFVAGGGFGDLSETLFDLR